MPKLKTHKGAAARFGATGTGKLVRMKRHSSHLRRTKPKDVRRQYGAKFLVTGGQAKRAKALVPALNR